MEKNTASERRRMRNERKKRKLLQRRKANDHSKLEANAVIEELAERLHKESDYINSDCFSLHGNTI